MTRLQRAGRLGHAAGDELPPERPPLVELRALRATGEPALQVSFRESLARG